MSEEAKKDNTPLEAEKTEEKPAGATKNASDKESAPKEKAEKKEIPRKFKNIVGEIEKMSVLDLAELVKVLEDRLGVSAAVPMAITAAPGGGEEEGGSSEKSAYDVELTSAGSAKIAVIKLVREITGKGLKEAKDIVDAAPQVVKAGVSKAEADELKKKLEEAGAGVELK